MNFNILFRLKTLSQSNKYTNLGLIILYHYGMTYQNQSIKEIKLID